MNDVELIAGFSPESEPDAETRRRAWARLEERIAGERSAAGPSRRGPRARRRLIGASAAAAFAAAAAAAAVLSVGGPGGPGVEDARAAVAEAARATAASARSSGMAVVRITHDGSPWAGSTLRWHGADLDLSHDQPRRPGEAAAGLRVVGGALYGRDPRGGGWIEMGPAESIDPGSGTTPGEYLAAVEEDVSGATLRRISAGVQDLVTRPGQGGSTVYSGTVAAGLVARESAVKGDRPIRVLPFGYVAHDEAADPGAPLRVDLTVGGDGVVRRIVLAWGAAGSRWTYAVDYDGLGASPPIAEPADAAPLRR